jgi:hypothetical protein
MPETNLNTKLEAVFSRLMDERRGPMVSESKAKDIVVRRKRMLSLYTQPGMSGELKEEFEGALKWTESSYSFAQTMITLVRSIATAGSMSGKDMLLSARQFLDSARLPTDPTSPFADEIAKLRDRVLLALLAWQEDPSRADETVSETLDKELRDLSDLERGSATLEAALLLSQVKAWRVSLEALGLAGQVALICRNILYRGLFETLGSGLERQVSWEKFKEDFGGVPIEAAGTIPVIGDVVGKTKLLIDMAFDLFDKERVLQDEAADLATKHARAHEFVELYSASIQAWSNWAVPLSKSTADMLLSINKEFNKGFAGETTTANASS